MRCLPSPLITKDLGRTLPNCYSAIFRVSDTLLKANLNVEETGDSRQGVIEVAYLLDNAPELSHSS